ncbi:MAG: hypothetical protein U0324_45215 [Polyangiales bacterium]
MRRASLCLIVAALAACPETPRGGPCAGGECPDADAALLDDADAPEAALDAAKEPDAAPDVVTDVAADAVDAAPDTAPDAAMDVAPDAAMDAAPDAAPDAASDASLDVVPDRPDAAPDAVMDVAPDRPDAPADASPDARDAAADASPDVREAGVDVPPTGGCISGAVGTHVARFRWTGTTSGSRASVSYEANTLPDRARWRVTAASRSIGYTPVFGDPFLGEGGLELSGTVFIDVELSTAGLGAISNVTLAVYGRSYNTTASGSFAWRTFSGSGSTPSGFVSNVAPYRWYRADATASFVPGDSGVLLRITPGPPSGALVVSRVEVCFDAR